jgi:hypothetical protein
MQIPKIPVQTHGSIVNTVKATNVITLVNAITL